MGKQRSFGLSRRAGGVDDCSGIVAGGIDWGESVRFRAQRIPEGVGVFVSGGIDAIGRFQVRQRLANLLQLLETGVVGDQRRCAAIGEPVLDGIDAEQLKQRHRDITRLVDSQMRDGRLRRLRQEYPHAVAALKPPRASALANWLESALRSSKVKRVSEPSRVS